MMIFPLLAAIFCLSLPNPYPTLALPAPPRPGGFPFVPQQTGGFPPFPSPAPWGNNNNNNGSYIWGNSNSGQISPNFTNNNSNNTSNKNITTSINQSSMPNNNNSSSNMYATTFMSPRQREANNYFAKFGYISKASSAYRVASDRIIAQFQHMAGLPESGQLDDDTMAMMQSPRCGTPDVDRTDDDEEPARFLAKGKWSKTDLTYRVEKYTTRLAREEVDKVVAKAFDYWAQVSSLTFTRKNTGVVDIVIMFQVGEHGDNNPFDGRGEDGVNVLAHAYYPFSSAPNSIAGDAHFDDAELWTINSSSGQDLLQVATHEFGHSLGLGHSDDRDAVMWAYAKRYEPSLRLGDDDIRGIQSLYGPPEGTTPTTTTTTTTTTAPTATTTTTQTIVPTSTCTDTSGFDAIDVVNGRIYAFRGNRVLTISLSPSAPPPTPQPIRVIFPDAPFRVDAAVTVKRWRYTYLFSGASYYRFSFTRRGTPRFFLSPGYPKPISHWGAPALFNNGIDAAFEQNGKLFFIKGNDYWQRGIRGTKKVSQGCGGHLGFNNGFGSGNNGGFGSGIGGGFGSGNSGGFGSGNSGSFGSGNSGGFGSGIRSGFESGIRSGFGSGIRSGFGSGIRSGFGSSIGSSFGGNLGGGVPRCGWPGLPLEATHAAFQLPNGRLYFFTADGRYYRWNHATNSLAVANPAYPRRINEWWLGCGRVGFSFREL